MDELPIARPVLGPREQEAAAAAVASGWVAQGPRVAEFEGALATATGAAHACAVSSGTAALELALRAAGTGPGDVVVTVSHSFIATANAVRACGAEPVFVDIDPATLNACPTALARCLETEFTPREGQLWFAEVDRLARDSRSPLARVSAPLGRLACVLVAHQVGMPAPLEELLATARGARAPLVEDAACALGSRVRVDGEWSNIGRPHGTSACFSFHPRKIVTTGEGGAVTTRGDEADAHIRALRQHGRDAGGYSAAGYNFRMTDIQAAVGLVQLERLNDIVAERRRLAALYAQALDGVAGLDAPREPDYARTNWQSYIPTLHDADRQAHVIEALARTGIAAQPGIMCAHLEAPYRGLWPDDRLRQSAAAHRRGLSLPLFVGMTDTQVDRVVTAVASALAH